MEESYKKVARILRTDKDYIGNIEKRFEVITGKKGMIDKILEENSNLVKDRLLKLGVSSGADVKTIYDALISKIESDDKNVFELLGQPNCRVGTDCQGIGEVAKKIDQVFGKVFIVDPEKTVPIYVIGIFFVSLEKNFFVFMH